jgi:hypothetical protein
MDTCSRVDELGCFLNLCPVGRLRVKNQRLCMPFGTSFSTKRSSEFTYGVSDLSQVCDLKKHSAPSLVDAPITASARRWEKKGLLETTVRLSGLRPVT